MEDITIRIITCDVFYRNWNNSARGNFLVKFEGKLQMFHRSNSFSNVQNPFTFFELGLLLITIICTWAESILNIYLY